MRETQGSRGAVVAVGNGGWCCYRATDLPDPIFARLREADDGRLEAAELYLPYTTPPSASGIRSLGEHLTRLTSMANAGVTARSVRARMSRPGPDLRTAASYYATSLGKVRDPSWAERMLLAQEDGSGEPKPRRQRLPALPDPPGPADLRLDVPEGRPYPDRFFAEAAEVYTDAAQRGPRPAVAVAAANGVSVKRVHRWVAEARSRGHLPAGRKGRYG